MLLAPFVIGLTDFSLGNIGILSSFVSPAKKKDYALIIETIIHPVARPIVDSQFPHPVFQKFMVTKVAKLHSVKPDGDAGFGRSIPQRIKPIGKQVVAGFCKVVLYGVSFFNDSKLA
jgi:hypothetical protein